MDSIRGPIILALFTLTSVVSSVATAQPQLTAPGGFVPRHERIATSILRSKTAAQRVAKADIAPLSEATPLGDLAPPAPPSAANSVNATTTSVGAGLRPSPSDQYPIILTESIPAPAPAGPLDDPFAYSGEMSYHDVNGGPSCGVAGPCGDCASCAGDFRWIDTISLNLGVAGFKNAINNGLSGSFGFQQGLNWGSPWVVPVLGMNTQLGLRTIQSEFSGTRFDNGRLSDDHRFQFFVTGGFFKRASCGWQGGIVFDYLRDEWIGQVDLGQVRGELSWAVPSGSSFGFRFATSVTEDNGRALSTFSGSQEFDTHDIYTAFYRVRSNRHRLGQWRVFAGFTGDSDGLIGSDFKIPLAGTWSIEPEFTYLVPDESTSEGGPAEEGWNVAFNLVWYPGRAVRGINYSKLPLFDVAGNGSMISRRMR